jgi:hypothetical protein
MTTTSLESSMLTLERRLRMGIVLAVAVAIPLVIWWQFGDQDRDWLMLVGPLFLIAAIGWLWSKKRKPLWAVVWSILGGFVGTVFLTIHESGNTWIFALIAGLLGSLFFGPIAGLYVSIAFWLAGVKGKPVKES